jgi:hypothetical protein
MVRRSQHDHLWQCEWQMIVLQELASAPKVTVQDQDGRLIEIL